MILKLSFTVLLLSLVNVCVCPKIPAEVENKPIDSVKNESTNSVENQPTSMDVDEEESDEDEDESDDDECEYDDKMTSYVNLSRSTENESMESDDVRRKDRKNDVMKCFDFRLYNPFTSGEELVAMGDELLKRRDKSRARLCYDKAAAKWSPKPSYFARRANFYLEDEWYRSALSDLKKAVSLAEKQYPEEAAKNNLENIIKIDDYRKIGYMADKLEDERNYEDAAWCYLEAIKRYSDKDLGYLKWYYIKRGNCLMKVKKLRETISNFKALRGIDLFRDEAIDLDSLFKLMTNSKESTEGVLEELASFLNDVELVTMGKKFHNIVENYNEAIRYFTEAIRKDPKPSYYGLRGNSLLKIKELSDALKDFEIVIRKNPQFRGFINLEYLFDIVMDSEELFRTHEEDLIAAFSDADLAMLGKRFYSIKKDFKEAIRYYNEAIKKNPLDLEYYVLRGMIYLENGNMNSAMSEFEEARRLGPNNKMVFQSMIKLLHQSGRIKELEEAVQTASDNDLIIIGRDYMTIGKPELALWAFNEALKKKSAATYYKFRALSYWGMKHLEKAIVDLRTSISLDPEDISYKISLIEALIDNREIDEAQKEMNSLSYVDPLFKLGQKFSKNGRHHEAIHCLDEVIRKRNDYCPEELAVRATSRRALERLDDAVSDLERALNHTSIESYNKPVIRELFDVMMEKRDYEEAKEAIEKYKNRFRDDEDKLWIAAAQERLDREKPMEMEDEKGKKSMETSREK